MQVDQGTLADILGVSARTIRTWQREGMPAGGDRTGRKYDTEACIAWAVANKLGPTPPGPSEEGREGDPPPEEVSDRRWKQARAALKQLEVEEEKGRLVPIKLYEERLASVLTVVRSRLLNLPGRYARELAPAMEPEQVERLLEEAVGECLEELRRAYAENDDEASGA